MKEKILVNYIMNFIILCIFRVIVIGGFKFEMNFTQIMFLLTLSLLVTVFLECFDYFIVDLGINVKIVVFLLTVLFLYLMKLNNFNSYFVYLLGYIYIVMWIDIMKVWAMKIRLEEYQKENK